MAVPDWLTSRVQCDGEVIAEPLAPDQLTVDSISDICDRMLTIMDHLEFQICEGRLLPVALFDEIDSFPRPPHPTNGQIRLDACLDLAARFGDHYGLRGKTVIDLPSKSD